MTRSPRLLGAHLDIFELAGPCLEVLRLQKHGWHLVALQPQLEASEPEIDVQRSQGRLPLGTPSHRCAHVDPSPWEQAVLILLRGVDQKEPCYLVRVLAVEDSNVVAAERMTYQNIGRLFASRPQRCMKFRRDPIACPRHRSRITVAVAGSIIGADTSESGDFRLHTSP